METIKLETSGGDTFQDTAMEAKELSLRNNTLVQFDFNGRICIIGADTNLDWLWRDYSNSWLMGWTKIGPDCLENYEPEVAEQLRKNQIAAEEKAEKEREEYRLKEEKERAAFQEKVKDVLMEFKSKADWEKGVENNKDPYGACIYEYAEGWAKLMQVEIVNGNKLEDIAEKASHELGFLGITGFMYGAAVSVLSHCWLHGERLRKWHNKEYNHEGEGVVNPAILTIPQ